MWPRSSIQTTDGIRMGSSDRCGRGRAVLVARDAVVRDPALFRTRNGPSGRERGGLRGERRAHPAPVIGRGRAGWRLLAGAMLGVAWTAMLTLVVPRDR
jgi:hypothetical protein